MLAGRAVWGQVVERPPVLYAVIQPAAAWSPAPLFFAELAGVGVIVSAVGYFLSNARLAPFVPWLVGVLIGLGTATLGTQSGGSFNPARQFGPAVVSGHTDKLWVFLLAPMLGAEIAARLLRAFQKRSQLTHRLCGTHVDGRSLEHRRPEVVLPLLCALLLIFSVPAAGQTSSTQAAQPDSGPPPYKILTQDEDWSYFHDPSKRSNFLDAIKYIPLGSETYWYLSLGGEIRERYEMEDYPWWGQGPGKPDHNGYSLQRYLLHAADEVRHSIGTRLSGQSAAWDFNYEAVFQWGSFGLNDIRAWTVASDDGYTLNSLRFRPRLGFRVDITSGDGDPNKDRTLRTFNPLFPKGSYFGEIALIGPANHIDLHPSVALRVGKDWTITSECIFFWRESLDDGIYRPPITLIRPAGTSRSRYVGTQPSIQVDWQINRHFSWTANYTHFFAGPFLQDTQPAKDVNYLTTWTTYRF